MLTKVPREKAKPVTFTFPASLAEQIDYYSAALGLSKSAFVRLAVLDYIRKENEKRK